MKSINAFFEKSKLYFSLLSYLSLAAICLIDIWTGYDLNVSILYFIPFYYYCINDKTTKKDCIIFGLATGIFWTFGNILTFYVFRHPWIPYVNLLFRCLILPYSAILLFTYKSQKKQIQQQNQELSRLNDEKNKYVGVIAHDLRSPLSQVISISDILLEQSNTYPEDHIHFLNLLKNTGSKMLVLINGILNITNIEHGELKLNRETSDFISFIKEVIKQNQLIASQKNIVLSLDAPIESAYIVFDSIYMELVMNNIISNAIKYSYRSSNVKIVVNAENNFIKTEIIDEGVGIKPEEIDNIFIPFNKGSLTPTEGEDSYGLGLFLVKKVIEEHKGKVWAERNKGRGSTFCFQLPV